MRKGKSERVTIFIDGSNFYHGVKDIKKDGLKIRLQKIVNDLVGSRELVTAFYYNALLDKKYDPETYKIHNKFIDIVRKFPKFKVVLCDWRKITEKDGSLRYDTKGDDVCLTTDLLMGAFDNIYDIAIIVSGDADFIPVIKILRRRFKKKIGNGYFRSSSSYKLRNACDFSVNLKKVIIKLNKKR